MDVNKPNNIDEYISNFPNDIQQILLQIRTTIKNAAPESQEVISYCMPAFKQNGILVYFAAFKNHIGFYPTVSGIRAFQDQFQGFKFSKGSIQFPINKPIPFDLITEIVKFRLNEILMKTNKK